ncbi:heavy metal translocating P-type ATPase [Mesobacterium sp. TK19101]|uniref:Heavy metal translocating P-type ATPase n=1 Tax=Mesobacterium hydrothermale TaxID=3111907 RepID=A0ABU6HGZ1_9RHOB|nr:heavy metal translocating P-type ATPase [Mesobacterium sp. TK19101]MEC3861372.1 heavy metal translocating P-type ATPase [Mesobacterium sp. TK19101]
MEQVLKFDVERLSCAGCAGRAQRALQGVEGVEDASVNIATKAATVTGAVSAGALQAALTKAGYPGRETRSRLSITGMTCASCSARVETALQKVPGVLSATVNLANQSAEIRHLHGSVDPATLARTVSNTGYPAEPVTTGAEADDRSAKEHDALRRDLIIAGTLTFPVFVAEMGGHLFPPLHHWLLGTLGQGTFWFFQFVLITAVLAWPGLRFYRIGLPLLAKGAPDMNSLVALGTLAAWSYSTVALFAPALLPDGARAVYFEAAGVIVTLILLGRWLESRAKGQTGAAIRALIGLRPDTARVERDGTVVEIPVEDVVPGDLLHLRPGERVAVDGTVQSGGSWIDESMITGEPIPVQKSEGASVVAGTINGQGALTYRATSVGADTLLARIVAMVEDAQGARLPVQALADKVVLWFVPAVLLVAAITFAFWFDLGPQPSLGLALVAGVSVLIIACPCAMGLATPTSIMVGTGRAAQMGVLFRKGDALQRLQDVRVVAFDKTGTLTEGKPVLTGRAAAAGFDADKVLHLAASAEAGSEHPIARAMEAACPDPLLPAENVQAIAGFGLSATVDGKALLIGAPRLMEREGIAMDPLTDALTTFETRGETPILVAVDGQLAAVFSVSDPLKSTARNAIAALHDAGLAVALITGDTEATASAIARQAGIDHVVAGVLPDGKVKALENLRKAHGAVAFVGDGINDAPALAAAEVGIAMGTGTDVAIETGDIVLVSGDPQAVVNARHISARTMRNIRQNLFWAFGYNIVLIPVAAGVFYPLTGLMLSPMLAAGAMALSSVFVVSNALRLRRIDPVTAPATHHHRAATAQPAE